MHLQLLLLFVITLGVTVSGESIGAAANSRFTIASGDARHTRAPLSAPVRIRAGSGDVEKHIARISSRAAVLLLVDSPCQLVDANCARLCAAEAASFTPSCLHVPPSRARRGPECLPIQAAPGGALLY